MKKIVLICGLISGAIAGSWGLFSAAFCHQGEMFEYGMWFGYAAMLLGFSLIFVGVKNYRDNQNGGVITFGAAFKVAALIALIGSTVYVVAWIIDFKLFIPDFMDKYAAHVLDHMHKSGATAAQIKEETESMAKMKGWYKNIFFVIILTYAEILPVGLIISLIAAVILKRKMPPADLALQA